MDATLTPAQRKEIAEVLQAQANDIAAFSDDMRHKPTDPAHMWRAHRAVQEALTREMRRLRRLADTIYQPPATSLEEEE